MNINIDLERRYKLLTARDKRNAYQRAYQAKRKAAQTPEQHEQFKAWRREYQKNQYQKNKEKNKFPHYEKTLIEKLVEAHERRKAYQRAWSAKKRACLTPEELERKREYHKKYYAENKEKIASYAKRRLAEKNELKSKKEILKNEKRTKFIDSIIARS